MADLVLQMKNFSSQEPDFLFLGMPAAFSIRVLDGLLQAGKRPSAIWIADDNVHSSASVSRMQPEISRSELPLVKPYLQEGLAQLAWEHNIPVFLVGDISSPDTVELLESLQIDLGIVACFPMRLPQEILTVPRFGFLNLHPSLLPAYRGPFPLFWAFRHGLQESGITLHHVDIRMDTGDIVEQTNVFIPDGIGVKEADALFATEGTALILNALSDLAAGSLAGHAQGAGASTYGRPSEEDFIIPTEWTAQRAFNFMRGTAEWQMPYRIQGDDFEILVRSAVACNGEATMGAPIVSQGNECWIMFRIGILHARIW